MHSILHHFAFFYLTVFSCMCVCILYICVSHVQVHLCAQVCMKVCVWKGFKVIVSVFIKNSIISAGFLVKHLTHQFLQFNFPVYWAESHLCLLSGGIVWYHIPALLLGCFCGYNCGPHTCEAKTERSDQSIIWHYCVK